MYQIVCIYSVDAWECWYAFLLSYCMELSMQDHVSTDWQDTMHELHKEKQYKLNLNNWDEVS